MGYLASGKLLKVGVEFSLEDPQGGIHFVVPEGNVLQICISDFSCFRIPIRCYDIEVPDI